MDRLWAPWRSQYITSTTQKKTSGCLLCRLAKEKTDRKNYIVLRRKHCYAVLNLYPYNNGHVMVVPYRHVKDTAQLTSEEKQDFFECQEYMRSLLTSVLKPDGFNVGMNLGHAAGAGVPKHVHAHIVPRWVGDVNFMPVMGNTKVISQSLKDVYRLLTAEHKNRKGLKH